MRSRKYNLIHEPIVDQYKNSEETHLALTTIRLWLRIYILREPVWFYEVRDSVHIEWQGDPSFLFRRVGDRCVCMLMSDDLWCRSRYKNKYLVNINDDKNDSKIVPSVFFTADNLEKYVRILIYDRITLRRHTIVDNKWGSLALPANDETACVIEVEWRVGEGRRI